MNKSDILSAFQMIGRDLFAAGLNNSHSGNMSVRIGDKMLITRTGSMLHHLTADDLIETAIGGQDEGTKLASRELPVHRAIYQNTGAMAIVHAHPPYLVALTMDRDCKSFTPHDAEGLYYFGAGVSVLDVKNAIASEEVAAQISPSLKQYPAAIVKSHGVFSVGSTLEEAYHWISSLEHSAKIASLR